MGNTCQSDFCMGNEEFNSRQVTSLNLRESRKTKIESDDCTYIGKFPDLTKQAAQRIEELVDMDFTEQQKDDNTKKQFKKQAFRLKNGWIYQGEWHKKKIWGKGKYYTPNKCYIQCYSVDGQPEGKLRIVHPNGDFYQGTTKNFKAEGRGILYQNRIQYEGNFIQNYLTGQGRQQSDDYIFEGIYENGKKVSGKLVWNVGKENETMYDGNFYDEKFDGRGSIYNNIGVFRGFFKNGKKFGDGLFLWKNGARFQGQYENDMKNGPGLMFNPNGVLVLKTVWQNDKPIIQSANSKLA